MHFAKRSIFRHLGCPTCIQSWFFLFKYHYVHALVHCVDMSGLKGHLLLHGTGREIRISACQLCIRVHASRTHSHVRMSLVVESLLCSIGLQIRKLSCYLESFLCVRTTSRHGDERQPFWIFFETFLEVNLSRAHSDRCVADREASRSRRSLQRCFGRGELPACAACTKTASSPQSAAPHQRALETHQNQSQFEQNSPQRRKRKIMALSNGRLTHWFTNFERSGTDLQNILVRNSGRFTSNASSVHACMRDIQSPVDTFTFENVSTPQIPWSRAKIIRKLKCFVSELSRFFWKPWDMIHSG